MSQGSGDRPVEDQNATDFNQELNRLTSLTMMALEHRGRLEAELATVLEAYAGLAESYTILEAERDALTRQLGPTPAQALTVAPLSQSDVAFLALKHSIEDANAALTDVEVLEEIAALQSSLSANHERFATAQAEAAARRSSSAAAEDDAEQAAAADEEDEAPELHRTVSRDGIFII